MESIGRELKRLLKKHKVSVYKMTDDLGIAHESLYRSLKNGANPEWNRIKQILDYLGYDLHGKEIRLIADENDKDARGRLLRYVTAGEVFVNLDLLEKGLATVSESDTDFACLASFKAAEQNSYNMKSGLWSLPQTIPIP